MIYFLMKKKIKSKIIKQMKIVLTWAQIPLKKSFKCNQKIINKMQNKFKIKITH